MPVVNLEFRNATEIEVARGIKCMEEMKKAIIADDPDILSALEHMKVDKTIMVDSAKNNIEVMKGGE